MLRPRRSALLGSLAAAAGAGAFAAGQVEFWALAGAGALVAAAQAWKARRETRRASALAIFLGGEKVVLGPGTWTSLDGARRVRSAMGDALVRWEHLDPSTGETLASFRAAAPVSPAAIASELLACEVAPLFGRARDARCFTGLPPELGGEPLAADASSVRLEVRRNGVLLVRCDAGGSSIGDTLHTDVASAIGQLRLEYGDHVGAFRPGREACRSTRRAASCWDAPHASRLAL